MLECQQYSCSVVITAALITWLFIASIDSLAQAKDLVTLERDINSTLSAIKSWEGVIRIEIEGGDSPYTANGTFEWDARGEQFRFSIEFPTNLNLLDEKNLILESTTVKRLREVIVKDGARLEIWHGGDNSSIPGFEIAERYRKRLFSIGYRRELDPLSLIVPQLEFCPEFLYRANVPSMRGFCDLL